MNIRPLTLGETGYLVPRRDTAPSAAYRQPKVTVIGRNGPRLTVRLDDGTEIETDERNVLRHRPQPPKRRKQRAPVPRPSLPDGAEEIPLW